MSHSHQAGTATENELVRTFVANLRNAFINRETLSIGGGVFWPEDYKAVIPILKNHERDRAFLKLALIALDTMDKKDKEYPNLREELRYALEED